MKTIIAMFHRWLAEQDHAVQQQCANDAINHNAHHRKV
jgi:hypothetical protein